MSPWRHPLIRIALYLIAVAAAAYFLFLSPGALRAHVKRILEQQLDAHIELGAVSFHPLAGLTLDGLAVRRGPAATPIFKAARVRLRPRWSALLRLRLELAGLSLQDADVFYRKESSGLSSWSGVLRERGVPKDVKPPVFTLRNGRIMVGDSVFQGLDCEITSFPSEKIIAVRGVVHDPFWGSYLLNATIDTGTETIRLSFESESLRVTEEWVTTLPVVGRDIWSHYRPAGLFDLTGSITHCWGAAWKTDYSLLFTAKDSSCTYLVFPVANATGRVFIDPHSVVVNHLRGEFFRGKVEGYTIVNLDEPSTYFNRYGFTGADMGEVLKDFQTTSGSLGGTGSGYVAFQGDHSIGTLTGRGELAVPDARLWKFPVILSILSKIQYKPGKQGEPLQDCKIVFTLSEEGFQIEQFSLASDVLDIYGDGDAGFDGSIDLTFYVRPVSRTPIFLADLLLQQAIDGLSQNVIQFNVTGTLANPKLTLVPLRPVSRNIINFFDALTHQRFGR